jgi:hypothetical protein
LVTLILLNNAAMKTPILKPGFEFVFSLSLIAILGLPPMLRAQEQKDMEIKIVNGDTTVNGKNIKDVSPDERRAALRDIRHISGSEMMDKNEGNHRVFIYRRSDSTITGDGGHAPMITRNIVIKKDSLGNRVQVQSAAGRMRTVPPGGEMDRTPGGMTWRGRTGRPPMREPLMGFAAKNSQSFSYVNTDNNGISTRISFHLSDVTNDDLKRMPHVSGPRLEISDINIVPQFTTGKTLLTFTLPTKAAAEVKFMNSEGKILWSEKATGGIFTKSFVLGLNGVYYLQVKQSKGITLKKILKED